MHVKYSVAMKTSFYSSDLLPFFKNTVSFAMTLTKLVTMLTKKAMIFSKMVDYIHTNFLEIHVKYSDAMKTSF